MAGAHATIHGLLVRLARGDRSALEPTFTALWPILRGFARRALGDETLAEDAAQQAILKVFAQAPNFDASRDGLAWAMAITSYEVRTLRRKAQRRREEPMGEALERPSLVRSPEAAIIERDLERAARATLGELGEEDVAVIIAAIDGSRPSGDATFRKRLQRALARLRHAWRAKYGTP
jgi:RNA polymerase sigma-70 factor (ECF subfamily)